MLLKTQPDYHPNVSRNFWEVFQVHLFLTGILKSLRKKTVKFCSYWKIKLIEFTRGVNFNLLRSKADAVLTASAFHRVAWVQFGNATPFASWVKWWLLPLRREVFSPRTPVFHSPLEVIQQTTFAYFNISKVNVTLRNTQYNLTTINGQIYKGYFL